MIIEISIGIFSTVTFVLLKKYYPKKEESINYEIYLGKGTYPHNTFYPLIKKKYKNKEDYDFEENKIYEISKNPEKNLFLRNSGITIILIKDEKNNEIFSTIIEKSHY